MNARITKPSAPLFGSSRKPAEPARKALPAPASETEQSGPPGSPDRSAVVSTKLDGARLAKLDRLGKRIGGLVAATRSATLRWLLDQHAEEP